MSGKRLKYNLNKVKFIYHKNTFLKTEEAENKYLLKKTMLLLDRLTLLANEKQQEIIPPSSLMPS